MGIRPFRKGNGLPRSSAHLSRNDVDIWWSGATEPCSQEIDGFGDRGLQAGVDPGSALFQPCGETGADRCQQHGKSDWSVLKASIKNDLSGYLFKTTKRNPMILPVIMEI